jgi:hypothetical protein
MTQIEISLSSFNNQLLIGRDVRTAFYENCKLIVPILGARTFIHQAEKLLELPFY